MKKTSKKQSKWGLPKPDAVATGSGHGMAGESAMELVEAHFPECDATATLPKPPFKDGSPYIIVEKEGYDPYDSGSFESSKSRKGK